MDSHLLALETSSSRCGVAVLSVVQGRLKLCTAAHDAVGEHAERLLPMVDQLLLEAGIVRDQLSAIGFGQGPGGFTGLRVACGVAQGMAYALGLPVVPVGSLLAVAARDGMGSGADRGAIRLIVQDARMGEVYLAAYRPLITPGDSEETSAWEELQAPILLNAGDVAPWLDQHAGSWDGQPSVPIRLVGDALDAYPQLAALASCGTHKVLPGQPLRPDAEAVARLAYRAWQRGEAVPPEQAAPLYVRDKVAYTTLEREHGLGGNPKAQQVAAAGSGRSSPVSICTMTAEHLDEVLKIERAVQSFPWTRGNFSDALQAGYGAWVACRDNIVLGACLAMFAPDAAHLLLIAVSPDAQRQGVGAQLLQQCERAALEHSLKAVLLEVRPSNGKALDFYRHRGFERLGVRKNYYPTGRDEREDAWVLEKKLGHIEANHD
ncbi:tRNA (adenosine(37)-N6)-threonylcarbamoyltransferase complex dimerization subunit type 1 TsaB [Paralcaligenes sp. KSB-10]|uniref:tRNA (adenosine(37)-N6)-threonylcarbamoyltransferase complex dimerization subunit type 1 TsaB n=1 Tax=Paralcaligenes sp. KSB-10 TaxID=2901142 RepID=UPI001E42FBE5|nr:tRNA (adenosine(37)-N6)-threonylcarbamoyltransferase complex dimerization subunit type 1 TsaB [Paralcaligenes sp. KSB-10]UHL66097.1 tRNA (adenosine(37)-N6)-threonylcarbamoyltransferase complex dimerization subunit type 1 TsaB [Paralcaligenes sp. KSB-10]